MNNVSAGLTATSVLKEIPSITQAISVQIDALDTQLAALISRLMPFMIGQSPATDGSASPLPNTEYGNTLNNLYCRLSSMTDSIQEAVRRLEI